MSHNAIFFTFDDNYVIPAAVTFKSLLTNALPEVYYDLYVLHRDISPDHQTRLIDLVKTHGNATLQFVDVSRLLTDVDFNDKDFFKGDGFVTFTLDTLYRCIPDLISEFNHLDTILYSDVDIVVLDDISELFDIDLKDHYLAGCKTPKVLESQITHLDPKFQKGYFGGGIWLMNLKKIREDKLGLKVLEIIKNPPCYLLWNDQDVMNLACDQNFLPLSYRYCGIPRWEILFKDNPRCIDKFYPNGEMFEALTYPKIVHYAYIKPWIDSTVLRADLWFYWLIKTDFSYNDFPSSWRKHGLSRFEQLFSQKFIGLSFLLVLSCLPIIKKMVKHRNKIITLLKEKLE